MASRKKGRDRMRHIVLSGKLSKGDQLYLNIPEYIPGDKTFIAEVTGETGQSNALRWISDGNLYAMSTLAKMIYRKVGKPIPAGLSGIAAERWINSDGLSLAQLDLGKDRQGIPDVSRQQLVNAMNDFDLNIRSQEEWQDWADNKSFKYAIFYNEEIYPVKTIISIATGLTVGDFSGGDQANGYVQQRDLKIISLRAHSWIITSGKAAAKILDKSAFLHKGTGIPIEIKPFFITDQLEKGERKTVVFVHENQEYSGHIERESHDLGRTRLFWNAEFSKVLRNTFPYHYHEYDKGKQPVSKIILLFERIDKYKKYRLNFSGDVPEEKIAQDITADKIEEKGPESEGREKEYYGKHYERSAKNRKEAIRIHGLSCKVCNFNFESVFGSRGSGFIEVHHVKPISTFKKEQPVNPQTDLITVCSNCHRMLHREPKNVLTTEKLKDMIVYKQNTS